MGDERRRARWLAGALTLLVVAALGFWAGRVTFSPVPVTTEMVPSEVTVEVTKQTVGRSLNLNVSVSQPRRPLATNALSGVVTEVRNQARVKNGDVLYAVAGVPVRAVQGKLPFYRSLETGHRGRDVRQLQDVLVSLKLLDAGDGKFGATTFRAVKAWQKKLGISQTGKVELGELVAIPVLPTRVELDRKVLLPGVVLAGSEQVVFGASGDPVFQLELGQNQARLVPTTATITIAHEINTWRAVIISSEQADSGDTIMRLASPAGGPVCGKDCTQLPAQEELILPAEVTVVPTVTGPAIPVASVTTGPDGSTTVVVVDGSANRTTRPVTVLGSQHGVAVVEGVALGVLVQVLSASETDIAAIDPGATPRR